MKKIHFYFLILILIFPALVFADGGMIPWPPEVELNQYAQNAIVGWRDGEEILILSVDLESSAEATNLRIIPLPSNPSEIKEGDFESFEKLVEIMNQKIEAGNWKFAEGRDELQAPGEGAEGVEITFQEEIGAHDITVVKVNDLDYFLDWINDFTIEKGFEEKEISSNFREGIKNYLKKDIQYFVFDVIETGENKESVKPLVYRFQSDFLYYPLLISGVSEISSSKAEISLFLMTEKDVENPEAGYYLIELTKEELESVSEDLSQFFEEGASVMNVNLYNRLSDITVDLMVFPSYLWDSNLAPGDQGEKVKALQQILINYGFWESEVGATGYFGPVTKEALIKLQEKYSWKILEPVDLKKGTGSFGPQTREYFESISLSVEQEELVFARNLSLGMSGDDVKALQEILIAEGVWGREDIPATGYFGPITKEAVIKYQEKYASEILEPLGLTKGTGFVGSSTRKHLEEKYIEPSYQEYIE